MSWQNKPRHGRAVVFAVLSLTSPPKCPLKKTVGIVIAACVRRLMATGLTVSLDLLPSHSELHAANRLFTGLPMLANAVSADDVARPYPFVF